MLEQCIVAHELGGEAAVDAFLRDHPTHAEVLRARLRQLSDLGILHLPRAAPTVPERLGDFRLIKQLGRGGMGAVWLAEQTSLQRQVALKLVHPELLFFPGARERFRREVLALARLQHPGIVPILLGGEADGVPFYAMEVVRGGSLAEVLLELPGQGPGRRDGASLRQALAKVIAKKDAGGEPNAAAAVFHGSWSTVAARLALDAARALQHAHEHGVLHRDLKPSNLLLDVDGRVRLIDFGLATAAGEQRLTRSGSTLGSLPYMAPEQVRGQHDQIDVRSDVYQLGASLYELLTGQLPHGDGTHGTRDRIIAGHLLPPTTLVPSLHKDLEAICLCAMDVDRNRRYPSASALGDDLQAFLEHRTVRARAPSGWLRARRWVVRNPGRAAVVAFTGILLVPTPALFAWQQHLANREVTATLAIARENLQHARAAIQQMLVRTSEARLQGLPRTAQLRQELISDAIALHERLLVSWQGSNDRQLRVDQADAESRLATLRLERGDLDAADALFTSAIAALRTVLAEGTAHDRVVFVLADALEDHAVIAARKQDIVTAEQRQAEAVARFTELRARLPDRRSVESLLQALILHAKLLERLGRDPESEATFARVEAQVESDRADGARWLPVPTRVRFFASIADARGVRAAQCGRSEEAAKWFTEALRRIDSLPVGTTPDRAFEALRVQVLQQTALLHHQRGEVQAAAPLLDRAIAAHESLVLNEPEFPKWRAGLARLLGTRAGNTLVRDASTRGAAANDHDRAVQLLREVVAATPDDVEYRRTLAVALAERGSFRIRCGESGPGLADLDTAAAELQELVIQHPDDDTARQNLDSLRLNQTQQLAAAGDVPGARRLLGSFLAMPRPRPDPAAETMVQATMTAADLAMRDGDPTAARAGFDAALRMAEALVQERPQSVDRRTLLTTVRTHRGGLLGSTVGVEAALAAWQAALPDARAVAGESEAARLAFGVLLLRLCRTLDQRGDSEGARGWFRQAVEAGITAELVARMPALAALFAEPRFQDLLPRAADAK